MSRKNKTKSSLLAACCMPVLICLLCGGIALLALIRPYEKMSTYLHIAFMDSMKTGTGSGTDGLQIKETEIDTNYSGSTSGEGSVVIPSFGEQYAILSCEAIDLYVPVYWGGGSELLELGACQSSGSAAIGSKGNSVISAHVNTFFQNLNQLQKGDTLTLYTSYGRFTYTVSELISFADTDEQYLIEETLALKHILEEKHIPAFVDVWGKDVNHDWDWWYVQMPYFLDRILD